MRRIKLLNNYGLNFRISWTRSLSKNIGEVYFELHDHIDVALRKLDYALGMWPFNKATKLSKEEQDKILSTYKRVLNKEINWPSCYFKNYNLDEITRVVLPFALENVLKLNPEDCSKKDIKKARLGTLLSKYYGQSINKFLRVCYPWLKLKVGRKEKWNKDRASEAIRLLVNSYSWSPDEAYEKIRHSHFREKGLLRILYNPQLGLKGSLDAALNLAYQENILWE